MPSVPRKRMPPSKLLPAGWLMAYSRGTSSSNIPTSSSTEDTGLPSAAVIDKRLSSASSQKDTSKRKRVGAAASGATRNS